MNEKTLDGITDRMWAKYHGKIDRIVDGEGSGQMSDFKEMIKEVYEDGYRDGEQEPYQ